MKTVLSVSAIAAVEATGKSCEALAMSGGGSKGAYEIGGLWGLVKSSNSSLQWDVVTGVSAGSLNTAIVTGFARGDETNMVEYASDLFANTQNSNAY
jgi:predicted acylesterase/phospholipase RssA